MCLQQRWWREALIPVLCGSENMALTPARLLLPVRTAEPAHPSARPSASQVSSFFLYPTTHRIFSPLSARVFEAPSHGYDHYGQFRRQPNETAPFDDLPSLYEEERDTLSYSKRNPKDKTSSAQRRGRGGGNSARKTWEPSNYRPWPSVGTSGGDTKSRYGKSWSSAGRNASSWTSQTEDVPEEVHPNKSWQTREGQRDTKFDMGSRSTERTSSTWGGGPPWEREARTKLDIASRSTERTSFNMRGGANVRNGNPPWERQGRSTLRENGVAYNGSGNPHWRRQGSFPKRGSGSSNNESERALWSSSQRGSRSSYNEIGNPPWQKEVRAPQQGSFSGQERHRTTQTPLWQDKGRESSWEEYSERSSSTDGSTYRHFNGDITKENRISQRVKNPVTYKHPIAPWQSISQKELEWKAGGRETEAAASAVGEEGYGMGGEKADLEGKQTQNGIANSNVSSIARIMERLRTIEDSVSMPETGETGRLFRGGLADHLSLPSAKEYLSDRSAPQPATEDAPKGESDTRFPWEIEGSTMEDVTIERARRLRPLSTAELTLPTSELKRLRILAVHLKQRVKIGKHGVTNDLVSSIMRRFHTCEVVKVKCEGPPAGNMKLTLETLEKRTGGLIIWKGGSVAVLYRGKDFGQPVSEIVDVLLAKKLESLMSKEDQEASSRGGDGIEDGGPLRECQDTQELDGVGGGAGDSSDQPDSAVSAGHVSKQDFLRTKRRLGPEFEKIEDYAMELEDILTDLGPRYEEWTGGNPIPVDADLLPAVIPNYQPPYRLLPFGMKPKISNTMATHLRRLCRPLPPHFVVGRDRGLQGLASAMVKLWERSEIAKIGVKRGILNTEQERISEDLKQLTGGFFLCRDKRSMTFYRGNDFLPQAVSTALAERQAIVQTMQHEEETGRWDKSLKILYSNGMSDVKPSWVHTLDPEEQIRLKKEAAKARRLQIVYHIERRLKFALRKRERAGKELEKVEELIKPVGSPKDKETVTDEERFMLRKLGLKMKAFLLVGKRGVFSGVVQNMHLHWKHRELVKIVKKEKDLAHLKEMASMLEYESGGILISIDPTSKGYAMIYYRGKNYSRPPELRPPNLLTKRLALKRSVEIQRRASLARHIELLEKEIVHLRAGLSKLSTEALETCKLPISKEQGADAHGSLKLNNDTSHSESNGPHDGLLEKEQGGVGLVTDEEEMVISKVSKQKLRRLCELGPVFKAVRMSNTERHNFRTEVMNLSKAAQFMVGKSNPLSTVAKAIRLYFVDHAFIKIGVKNRPQGLSVQDVAEELEDLTGGTVYAQDVYKIVLYRGWPTGEDMPLGDLYNVLSTEQCDVLEEESDEDDEGDENEGKVLDMLPLEQGDDLEDDGGGEDNDAGDDEEFSDGTVAEFADDYFGEESDRDVDARDEDEGFTEGGNGLICANTWLKDGEYISDGDEDVEWHWSGGDTEDDGDDGGDDFGWLGRSERSSGEEHKNERLADEENDEGHRSKLEHAHTSVQT